MPLLAVLAPVVAGLTTLFLPLKWTTARPLVAMAGPLTAFVLVLVHVARFGIEHAAGHPQGTQVLPWIPLLHLDLAFLLDGLGVFFALLVSGVGSLIVLYARGYFGTHERDLYRFFPTLGFFTTAMMGLVLSDYTLGTLMFWEMTSISSFLLIGWDRYDKHAVKLAMQAFFTTGLGGMGLFGGVLLFGETTGVWRWSELLSRAAELDLGSPGVVWAFVLMFIGAGTKSAQWPFHYWLPGAMAAPTPVSAFLHSATMVKAGVFLLGRLFPALGAVAVVHDGHVELLPGVPIWTGLIVPFGAVTMVVGGVLAVVQHDLKRIFAYTTVSQLGLLMTMYGLGGITFESHGHVYAALDWDITQIANHAFYKAPLFIIAGAIGHVAGTRSLPELFGYYHRGGTAKVLTVVLLLAGYALAAGPLTVSFGAKELFLYQVYHAAERSSWIWAVMAATLAMAACNVAIFVRLVTTLLGHGRFGMGVAKRSDADLAGPHGVVAVDAYVSQHGVVADRSEDEYQYETHDDHHAGHEEHDHERGVWPWMLWVPAAVLVAFQYVGGVVPYVWNAVFRPLESNTWYFETSPPSMYYALMHPLSPPLWFSILGIALGVVLGLSRLGRGAHEDINDRVYPGMYWLAVTGGGRAFRTIQTGRLRDYLLMSLVALLVGIAAAAWFDRGMIAAIGVEWAKVLEFWPGVLLGLLICITAVGLPLTQSRIVRVILLGACGFSVVGMYVLYQAPDLALTQLMFEIISVILFVLVLRLLPRETAARGHGRWWRVLMGTLSGVAVGWVTLVAASGTAGVDGAIGATLGDFFAAHSYTGTAATDGRGGGGHNIVNVILVDFRGFDTLGEITVLALAVMGVWSLMPGSWSRRRPSRSEEIRGEALPATEAGGGA